MKAKRRKERESRPTTAVVGGGALARAFLPGLVARGYPVLALAASTRASARKATRGFEGIRATASVKDAVRDARLVLLAVPDREIGPLARVLARDLRGQWDRRVVLHHAGALGLEPLAPLSREGASVGVLHPLQSLGRGPLAASLLSGARARIEGDSRAATLGRRLARDLGLVPFSLPRGSSAADRHAYHAAASLVSNDLLALVSIAVRLLGRIGVKPDAALRALAPLARGTLAQIADAGLVGGLTGPVARGDAVTLAVQLRRLATFSPEVSAVHRLLSREILDLARASGRLTTRQARAVRGVLQGASGGRSFRPGV